jgi:N4-bis(aminopropyl)spermidine synthase
MAGDVGTAVYDCHSVEEEIDLRSAVNAVSDVVQNRPRPLREFDQIYMRTGDMVLQSQFVARWADGRRLAFIGDGDAISVCVAYLKAREILSYGPSEIVVYDFDERICNAVARFADKEQIVGLRAQLYNVLDAFPGPTDFECFYTNPPWGASNAGESVTVFVERGMEATNFAGGGIAVVADDPELEWPKHVLANVQRMALGAGFFVQRLMPQVHSYHLDDAPNLRSCNVLLRAIPGNQRTVVSAPIDDPARLANFYGRGSAPRVHYVREKVRLDYGTANQNEYELELMGEQDA